ncbi:phage tail tip lysozyme [Enterococcus faecium]|nr:phage tail tip lysozyme [Enterococcus faecium]
MFYLFDSRQQLIKRLPRKKVVSAVQTKEITSDKSELLNDTFDLSCLYSKDIEDARFMAVRESENEFSLYRILKTKTPTALLSFSGVNFGSDELDGYVVKDIRPQNESAQTLINRLFESAGVLGWEINVHTPLPNITDTFYYVTVREALKVLQTHGMEFTFKCVLTESGIAKKVLHVYDKIGVNSGMRFTYGDKALTVEKEIERTNVVTSLIGRGRGEQVGDGYGRRIEFDNVVWDKAKGDPLNKPKGQIFLEDPEATAKHGIPMGGGMRKREKVLIIDDCEDPNELLRLTYENLIEYQRPLVQFSATVTGSDAIGNTVTIHRHERGYHYETRIYRTERDYVMNTQVISLGDNLTSNAKTSTLTAINAINHMEATKMTHYQSTEISKFQDDIMRGAGKNGGSVYMVNGIEAGVSDSRETYEYVWLNGNTIAQSTHFMTVNSEGISFKECKKGEWKKIQDVHNGTSHTAWTIDGTFNANFIMAGVLRGILIEGALLKTMKSEGTQKQYQAVVDHGGFEIQDAKDTPSEIDYRNGKWRDQVQGRKIAQFKGTFDAASERANGAAIVKWPGQIFSINIAGDDGLSVPMLQYPADSNPNNAYYNMLGKGHFKGGAVDFADPVTFNNTVTFNKKVTFKAGFEVQGETLFHNNVNMNSNLAVKGGLTINNGQAVYPGQGGGPSGGGGSTGGIPGELQTDAEKRAWQIYDILCNNGFTKQAACGILGNIQQETGGTFDPDTRQIGGPAYGLVQWDGSSYPLVGPATWDGKQYVTNLFQAARISEPVESIRGQVQLLIWTFTNGQWIGQVEPSTFAGFKACTDPRLAAYAFEKNYERPAATHPERQDYAQAWYNKFVNLKPSASTGEAGLKHLEALLGSRVGNGQCYALSAEFSGFLGGCGMGSGTKYSFSHVIGDTTAASNIGSGYDWGAVGWKVIFNPSLEQLVVGSIINWKQGASVGGPNAWTTDPVYGHTGVIRGLEGSTIHTYEQNTEYGQVVAKCTRGYLGSGQIASICIPPK